MTNIPNPLILVKRNTFSLNGWIKFHSKKFSLQKKTQRFFHRVVKFEEKKKKTRGSCFPRTSGKGGDLSQVWLREISWCVEGKPSINERRSRKRFRVGGGCRIRIANQRGEKIFSPIPSRYHTLRCA